MTRLSRSRRQQIELAIMCLSVCLPVCLTLMKGERASEQARSIGQVVSRSMAEQDYVSRLPRRSPKAQRRTRMRQPTFFSLSLSVSPFSRSSSFSFLC